MRARSPRLARLLLRMLPREDREYVLGDLDERYAEHVAAHGRLRARLWFWRQTAGTLAAFLARAPAAGAAGGTGWTADLRRGARSLARSPGFAALAVTTLALGIGALTAMFTVLDRVVLAPLPVEDQDRVVAVWNDHRTRDFPHFPFTLPALEAVREGVPSLSGVAATPGYGAFDVILTSPDGAEETADVALVVDDFFGVLGVRPAAGRLLEASDDVEGSAPVAVISWDRWTERWGRSPEAIGSTFATTERSYTVVGVLPEGFAYPARADVWVPFETSSDAAVAELDLVARMARGATAERVAEEIAAVYRARVAELPWYEGAVPVVRSLADVVIGDLRVTLLLLFGGALLVLGAASVNVASLVHLRAVGRASAVAVRLALGAGRGRLAREALAEAAWIGFGGCVAGAVLAAAVLRLLLPLAPEGLPRIDEVGGPDPTALGVAAGVTALVVVALTLVPVLRAGRSDPAAALRGGRGVRDVGGSARGRRTVVGVQSAMAVWAAAVGVLLLRSLLALQSLDPGFRLDDLVLVELSVPYRNFEVPPDLQDRMEQAEALVEAHPSVGAATTLLSPPLVGAGAWAFVPRLEGQSTEAAMDANPYVNLETVGQDYFATLGMPIVRGRPLDRRDGPADPPAVVVNEAAARMLWPGREALGRGLVAGFPELEEHWWTVVGVARSARYQDLTETRPVVYFPVRQMPMFPLRYMVVRVAGPWDFLLPRVRDAFRAVDPAIRVKHASSLRARLEEPLARPRLAAVILGVLAGTTLLLAAVGVYGVMASTVRARSGEMGVRLACGAAPGQVRLLVLHQGMRVAAVGAAAGVLAVLPGAAGIESLLFGVTPTDPWSLAAGALLVLSVALGACWVPAQRASRLDPARVLRSE